MQSSFGLLVYFQSAQSETVVPHMVPIFHWKVHELCPQCFEKQGDFHSVGDMSGFRSLKKKKNCINRYS